MDESVLPEYASELSRNFPLESSYQPYGGLHVLTPPSGILWLHSRPRTALGKQPLDPAHTAQLGSDVYRKTVILTVSPYHEITVKGWIPVPHEDTRLSRRYWYVTDTRMPPQRKERRERSVGYVLISCTS